jgi:hypothetical protein
MAFISRGSHITTKHAPISSTDQGGGKRRLIRQTFPGLEQPQFSRQLLNIYVLDKLLAANEIIVTEQLPLVGPSRAQMLAVRPQRTTQALNKGSFANRNVHDPVALADAAETRVSLGRRFRFVAARGDVRRGYCPRLKTFVRSPMKFVAATSRPDLPDLDSF